MTEPHDPPPSSRHELVRLLRWPLLLLAVVVVAALLAMRACWTVERGGDAAAGAVDAAGAHVADIAERFRTGTITSTFLAAIPRLVPDDSLRLELLAIEATETFTRTDDRRTFFDLVPLGTTVSEIRVPVTYRYHLRLDEPWRLEVRDRAVVVEAPPIRPTLPPAIHTDRMEKRSTADWLRLDADERMAELERSLTPTLSERAGDPARLDLVREQCRRRVAGLIRSWLEVEDHWRGDRFRAVTVVFADESPGDAAVEPPTLVLQPQR